MDYLHKLAEHYDLDIEWDMYDECDNTREAIYSAAQELGEEMRLADYGKKEIRRMMSQTLEILEDEEEEEEEEKKREKKRPAIFAE